jgi:hypothetical protein
MTTYKKNLKTKKNYKEKEQEAMFGKKAFRERKQQDQEALKELKEFNGKQHD